MICSICYCSTMVKWSKSAKKMKLADLLLSYENEKPWLKEFVCKKQCPFFIATLQYAIEVGRSIEIIPASKVKETSRVVCYADKKKHAEKIAEQLPIHEDIHELTRLAQIFANRKENRFQCWYNNLELSALNDIIPYKGKHPCARIYTDRINSIKQIELPDKNSSTEKWDREDIAVGGWRLDNLLGVTVARYKDADVAMIGVGIPDLMLSYHCGILDKLTTTNLQKRIENLLKEFNKRVKRYSISSRETAVFTDNQFKYLYTDEFIKKVPFKIYKKEDLEKTSVPGYTKVSKSCKNLPVVFKGEPKPIIVQHLHGDCLKVLKSLKENSVNCCVTSPPYWGLRDYEVEGQLGLESTPEKFIEKLVRIFREVRRVLRNDGTCWINMGDSFARTAKTQVLKKGNKEYTLHHSTDYGKKYKPKDLIGIPWQMAIALQDDGWHLREEVVWHKPAPKPESVLDRPTRAHEFIYFLTKTYDYFYDNEAVKEYTEGKLTEKDSVWSVNTNMTSRIDHMATYPEELIAPCIKAGCPENGTVIDPFGGSGTTALVCRKLKRNCVLIDINEEYVDMQKKRGGELLLYEQKQEGLW